MKHENVLLYRDNTGGVNLRSNESNINQGPQHTEFEYLQNLDIYRRGGLAAQKGNSQLNTGVTDTTAVLGIGEYINGSTTYAVYVKASGKAYIMNADGGAETEIYSGLNGSAVPQFANFNSAIIMFNGVNQPWAYSGTGGGSGSLLTGTPAGWSSDPPTCGAAIRGKRLVALRGSTVDWCAAGNYNDWTTGSDAGSVTDPFSDTSPFGGVGIYGDQLALHKPTSNRIYLMTGDSFSTYAVSPMASNKAASGKLAFTTINDFHFFFSGDGIYPLVKTNFNVIRLGPDSKISDKIEPFLTGSEDELPLLPVDRTTLDKVILLSYDLRNALVAYFKTSGSTTYDTAAIFDFDTQSWVFRKATPVTAAAKVGDYILTGTSDGKILREFTGTSVVNNASFIKRALSPWMDFGLPGHKKSLAQMYMWFKSTTALNMTLKLRADYATSYLNTYAITTAGDADSASYGVGAYDTNTYAASAIDFFHFAPRNTFRSFQFDLTSNDSTTDFRMLMFGFEPEGKWPY